MPLDLDEIRAMLASYRSGGKVGSMTLNAAKGRTLPAYAKEIHMGAPEIIDALLAEIDRIEVQTMQSATSNNTFNRTQ